MGTRADVSPGAFLLLVIRSAELANVSRAHGDPGGDALSTTLSMIASVWTLQPILGCQSFFLNWVQSTVSTRRAVPGLHQLEMHRPELRARPVEQPSSTKSGRTPHACA